MDSIIIYGPQGCGKTRHADRLMKHYGLKGHTTMELGQGFPPKDYLILTSMHPSLLVNHGLALVPFKEAMKALDKVSQ